MRPRGAFKLQNIGRVLSVFFALTLPQALFGAVFYVDASRGSDANNGLSPETPWKTIARVNGFMVNFNPGDKILLKRGTRFTDSRIEITRGGTAGQHLIFGAYGSGDKPVITHPLGGVVCVTPGIGHFTIEDLFIKDITGNSGIAFNAAGGSDVVISRVNIDHVPHHNGIVLMNINAYIIEDCVITNCENCGIAIMGSPSFPITNGIIRHNTVHDIFTNDGITLHQDGQGHNIGPNHQLLGNVCYRCAEQGLDITSGSRLVVRGNETYANGVAGILLGNASDVWIDKHYSHDERKMGIVIGGASRVKLTSSIVFNAYYHQLTIVPGTFCRDFEAYNNTIVFGPDSTGLLIDINANTSDLKFKNNVFASTQYSLPKTYLRYFEGATPVSTRSEFNNNIWWRPDGNSLDIFSDQSSGNYGLSFWQSHYGQGLESSFMDPLLVNPESGDFKPYYNSPCVDAGTNVGLSTDFAGNAIPFGPAPDIGAYEYEILNNPLIVGLSASTTSGKIPLLVNFTCIINGGSPPYSYHWDFGDGDFSFKKNPSHTYSRAGTFIAKVIITDSQSASNSKSAKINATDRSAPLAGAASLALAAETGAPAPGQGGTTNPSPGNHSFSLGSTVSVQSVPNADYRFSKWVGDVPESSLFVPEITLTMDKNRSLSATFCTKCADVNGDLKITPGDAQLAFDMYLGKTGNPTWCELENADVKCDGPETSPNVTPADALMILKMYLQKGTGSSACSGNSRAAALSPQSAGFPNVSLTINNAILTPGRDLLVPVLVESQSCLEAFGFDLAFPSNVLTFIGLESTELTEGFDELDANVISSPTANALNSRVLRVGGYRAASSMNPFSGVLVSLVFRVTGNSEDPDSISVIATYDDIRNATIRNGMSDAQSNVHTGKLEKKVKDVRRKFAAKRYEF
jgi:PKD repeat protein